MKPLTKINFSYQMIIKLVKKPEAINILIIFMGIKLWWVVSINGPFSFGKEIKVEIVIFIQGL